MNYIEQLEHIMGQVELFLQTHDMHVKSEYHMMIRTQLLVSQYEVIMLDPKDAPPKNVAKYEKIKALSETFPDVLKNAVGQPEFISYWNNLPEEEKKYLLAFDESSYKTIRQVLPAEEVYLPDWRKSIQSVMNQPTVEIMKVLGLPEELATPPRSEQELKELHTKLIELGCPAKEVNYLNAFYPGDEYLEDYTQFLIWITSVKDTPYQVHQKMKNIDLEINELDVELHYFLNQEKELYQKSKSYKM